MRRVVKALHDSPLQLVVATTGCGGSGISALMAVPGCSRTLLDARVPYSKAALEDFVEAPVAKYVSPTTADAMARAAYRHALALAAPGTPVAGVALTGSISSDRQLRGLHRMFVSAWGPRELRTFAVVLEKGGRDRAGEEAIACDLILRAAAAAADIPTPPPGFPEEIREERVVFSVDFFAPGVPARSLLCAPRPAVGEVVVVLCGSFNPPHAGHVGLLQAAVDAASARGVRARGYFELAVGNADKPPIPGDELARREGMVRDLGIALAVTSGVGLFVDKARLFGPRHVFLVGADTAARLVAPRFYPGGTTAAVEAALGVVAAHGCSFMVAGRVNEEGLFVTLEDIMPTIPEACRALFYPLGYRLDVSSTAIRKGTATPPPIVPVLSGDGEVCPSPMAKSKATKPTASL